jgi:hypothetical protein
MYSFGNREDTAIVDEPLYGYYLKTTSAKDYHPSAQEIMASMDCDGERVIQDLLSFDEKPIYFIKHMTHHLLNLNLDFLEEMQHILLTREPKAMIASFSKVIPYPTAKDLGYEDHIKLMAVFKQRGIPFHVVDSKEILEQPKERLKEVCNAVGIPFFESMLNWSAGARKEDGLWAKHWYANVHASTSFQKPNKREKSVLRADLKELARDSLRLYQKIIQA